PAGDVPELRAVIEVERNHRARRFGCMHGLDHQLSCRWVERGEDAAAVEPTHAPGKNLLPLEIARFELRRRLVATVVKHHRSGDAMSTVTINSCHVRAADAVVLESLVERLDAHGSDAFGDQLTERIIDQCRGDAGAKSETISEVGSHVEFATADVNLAF